jgi:hypothetical protein
MISSPSAMADGKRRSHSASTAARGSGSRTTAFTQAEVLRKLKEAHGDVSEHRRLPNERLLLKDFLRLDRARLTSASCISTGIVT